MFVYFLAVVTLFSWGWIRCLAQIKRAITTSDCVQTRRPVAGEVKLSPDGQKIAYIVKAPNLLTNRNDHRVYVRNLRNADRHLNGTLIFTADDVSGLRWLSDSRRIAFLVRQKPKSVVMIADVAKRTIVSSVTSAERISSFGMSHDSRVVAFSVNLPPIDSKESRARDLHGFPVKFGEPLEKWQRPDWWPNSSIIIVRHEANLPVRRHRLCSTLISAQDPCAIPGASGLSMSPDGSHLTFNYRPTHAPTGWQSNFVYKWLASGGIPVDALALYDLRTRRVRIAFDAPDAGFEQPTVWSGDGRSFTLVSLSPIGSTWEQEDVRKGFTEASQLESHTHLFAVDVRSMCISRILDSLPVWSQNPTLSWKSSTSPLLLRKSKTRFAWFAPNGEGWAEQGPLTSSSEDLGLRPSSSMTRTTIESNGKVVVAVTETPTTPPEILKYNIRSSETKVLTDLNPEYQHIALGQVAKIDWKNSFGAECTGYIVKPVGYQEGKQYPLIIMAKGWNDSFLSDTPYQTAFPPQPLANAGFVILMANMPAPKAGPHLYPGELDEAFNWMSMIESGVKLLSDRGMADPHRVGMIGFSRTSWLVDFMITHSEFPFMAASSADSGLYNYGTYWFDNNRDGMKGAEQEMGGPPYGSSFTTWQAYSPAFNAQVNRVPLLMEYCGYGAFRTPFNAFEFFVALNRQRKPVELYFYPRGEHVLDTPFERVASLQRNVDWFRFWMQNFERSDVDDREQYARWRELRELMHASDSVKRGPEH
jgi:dipeptidyl aminopeptidase/acylaminoacyl peptidase